MAGYQVIASLKGQEEILVDQAGGVKQAPFPAPFEISCHIFAAGDLLLVFLSAPDPLSFRCPPNPDLKILFQR